jgi:hypothetical protein
MFLQEILLVLMVTTIIQVVPVLMRKRLICQHQKVKTIGVVFVGVTIRIQLA